LFGTPKDWQWENIEKNIDEVYRTGTYVEDWSCSSTKSIQSGDRFFVVKVGVDKRNSVKGIVGSGFVIKEPYKKQSVKNQTKEALHVDLGFDNLLNPYKEDILILDVLQTGVLAQQR
jgi:5-methylcytosine-specific restriction protein A